MSSSHIIRSNTLIIGLIASLVSQFFSREFLENETHFSRKYQCESCESREKGKMRYIVKLASLAICESHNLRDLQTSKIIIHSKKLVLDPKFSQDSGIKFSNDSRNFCLQDSWVSLQNLSARLARSEFATKFLCETRKKRFSLWNFVKRLASWESVCETWEKRVSLLILTRESHENFGSKKRVSFLAIISKSDSRVNPTWYSINFGEHQHLYPYLLLV
jgi:hypothetical protein